MRRLTYPALVLSLLVAGVPDNLQGQGRPALIRGDIARQVPQRTVTVVRQAQDGRIWLGTAGGLYYYDGTSIRTAVVADEPRVGGSMYVRSMVETADGSLWVGTDGDGAFVAPPGARQFARHPITGRSGSVYVAAAEGGRVAFGTGFGMRMADLSASGEVASDPQIVCGDSSAVRSLASASGGDLIVGTTGGTVARVSGDGHWTERWCASMGRAVRSLLEEDESILVGTLGAGLQRLEANSGVLLQTVLRPEAGPRGQVMALHRDRAGTLFVGTRGGLALQHTKATGFEWLVPDPADPRSLPHSEVLDIAQVSDRSVWIGTWNGVAWLPPTWRAIRSIRHSSEASLPGEGVVAISRLAEGDLLAGGIGGGLFTIDKAGSVITPVDIAPTVPAPSATDVFDIVPQQEGALVAALGGGLLRYTARGITQVASRDCEGEALSDLVAVMQSAKGDTWAGSVGRGLLVLDEAGGRLCPYTDPAGSAPFEGLYVWPIIETPDGSIVFGVFGDEGGVVRLTEAGEWSWLFHGTEGRDGRVMTFHFGADSSLWVGTEGSGLLRVTGRGEPLVYDVEAGLPDSNIMGILEDDDGLLWLSTNSGLARLDPTSGSIRAFHESSGLSDSKFFANSAFKDQDGRLFFGGPSGITIVSPSQLDDIGEPPTAALTAFRINGEEAPLDRAVEAGGADLEPHENFFTLTFAALDFADPGANRYRYQLVGLDENWIDNGTSGTANYTSVPPGDYTFRVAARASEGIWNEDALSIPVHVQTPWQDTLWARSAGILLLLSVITGIYLYRLRQIEAREALRLGIAGKLHDDIGANLSAMALKTELVRTATELTDGKRKHLKDIGRLARDTAHKVRETAWIVNTEYDSLPGLASKMQDTAHTLLDGQVDVEFTGAKQLPRRPIDMELRQDTYLLFKELLQNVLKHSQATKAEIDIRFSSPHLQIRVQDNGVGFDMDEANGHSGNGLIMMRKRAAKHGGNVEFTPGRENVGTNALLSMRMK